MKTTLLSDAQVGRDHWIGFAAGVSVVLIFVAIVTLRGSPAGAAERTLYDTTLHLSDDAMHIYNLRVPHQGTLEIEAVNSAGHRFNIYVAVANATPRARRPNELPLLIQFTCEGATVYQRHAKVGPGDYHLALIKSGSNGSPLGPAPVHLRARLRT